MSNSYDYGLVPASPESAIGSRAPGLPPLDLPAGEPPPRREPLRVTVHPAKGEPSWLESAPDWTPPATGKKKPAAEPSWLESAPDWTPEAARKPERDVSGLEAFGRSAATGATFGLAPALEGVAAASGKPEPATVAERASGAAASRPILGALNLIKEGFFTGAGEGTDAYNKARQDAQDALDAGREQHPIASFAGELTGAAAVPLPGLAAAAAPVRIGRGMVAGGLGGAAYGAGSGISEGKSAEDIAAQAAKAGAGGAVLGGAFGGLLGPRAAQAITPGQRAAQTARDLGEWLPRGVASDSRALQATTSKLRQVPFAGERIGQQVDRVQEAAGRRVEQIAAGRAGVAPDRALAGSTLRPALQGVIDDNNLRIEQHYRALRGVINPNAVSPLARTTAALRGIINERTAAGMTRPERELQDIINLVGRGASFNGLQRARAYVGKVIGLAENNPNPGFNVGDFRRLYAAMTADMEGVARRNALYSPDVAANAFRAANRAADQLIERNKGVQRVLNVQANERLVGSLVTAAQEKTGNLRLLAQLRNTMHPDDFHQIGGVLLTELGHNPATGEFSLAKFVTNWNKVSDRAKAIMFSPQHLRNLEDIAGMGEHIKGALRESSTSHSASLLVMLDIAKDAALLGADVASGGLGAGSAIGAGTSAGIWMLARWLGNPAAASSMAAWSRARVGMLGHPTPARLAAFNIATRNLANNLGVPVESITKRLSERLPATKSEEQQPEVPRPVSPIPGPNAPRGKDQSRFH